MDLFTRVGTNLYWLRTEAGLSQEAVSVRMGVDRAYISAIERGRQNLTLAMLQALCTALGCEAEQLFDPGRPAKPPRATPGHKPATARRPGRPAKRVSTGTLKRNVADA